MHVLGIAGSLRWQSYNRSLLVAAGALLPSRTTFVVFEGLERIPAFNEDREDRCPAEVESLRRAVAGADALIVATPEYNASVPGAIKNALDWASRPWPDNCLRDKPTLVIGASVGIFGAVWAQDDMRRILRAAGADVVEAQVGPIRAEEVFDGRRHLVDAAVRKQLEEATVALAQRAESSASHLATWIRHR